MLNDYYFPSYEINPMTMAVVPQQNKYGEFITFVYEDMDEYIVDYSPSKVIDYACKYFGASLKGRQEGTREICEITHKAPIAIDPASGMYFFPTTSPASSKCSWIAHSHIEKVIKISGYRSEVIFKNGKSIIFNLSYGSLMNQIQRTAQFRYLLDKRISFLRQHKSAEYVAEPSPKALQQSSELFSGWQD